MNKTILMLLTSTAFGGLVSMLINFYQWRVKSKHETDEEERKRLYDDVQYFHGKYRDDEDEIDRLKDEIRKLKAAQVEAAKKRKKKV
ncbi:MULTISPECIES: hypothetical protein [unclassified Lactobacillus]|uniref:hypothetical protein n=1 Tax=unclassified Lactobacillus TaxID=2620435 RepID=UPI000EFD4782|nr:MULTISPECIES: hypothetical protein [unclassified Lactobacillus]RMC26039.1 hypothetical protein F5ESL0247_00580 [Lactobacillus sp. ESL0247]RMC29732.1 hypothetical protein F5ESL0246_00580 [Lactobacillus sp. ESL0246]RMC34137.1 hypothetical protein F5ESL0245_00580 [Lactobacillus sp. ESL0245]